MVSGVERAGGGRIIQALCYRNAGGDRLAVQGVRIREEDGRAADAEIVRELVTQDCGGRDYTARDLEGHVWTFGTYDPWVS